MTPHIVSPIADYPAQKPDGTWVLRSADGHEIPLAAGSGHQKDLERHLAEARAKLAALRQGGAS